MCFELCIVLWLINHFSSSVTGSLQLSCNQDTVFFLVNLRKLVHIIPVVLPLHSFIDSVIAVLDSLSSETTFLKIQAVLSNWFKMLVETYPVTEPNIAFVRSQVHNSHVFSYTSHISCSGTSTGQLFWLWSICATFWKALFVRPPQICRVCKGNHRLLRWSVVLISTVYLVPQLNPQGDTQLLATEYSELH